MSLIHIIYSNALGIEGKGFRFSANVHWMFFDSVSGKELARGTAPRCIPSETEAQVCQELANRLAAIWKCRLADLEKTLSIRYEKLPPNGRSCDYVTRKLEVGVIWSRESMLLMVAMENHYSVMFAMLRFCPMTEKKRVLCQVATDAAQSNVQ